MANTTPSTTWLYIQTTFDPNFPNDKGERYIGPQGLMGTILGALGPLPQGANPDGQTSRNYKIQYYPLAINKDII